MTYVTYPTHVFGPSVTSVYPTTTIIPTQPTVSLGEAFKPKKAGKNSSHIVVILDDSASMSGIRNETIQGFNAFCENQKEDVLKTGLKTYVSLYKFDGSNVVSVYNKVDVLEVPKLNRENYNPLGMTNLTDAIGSVMSTINRDFSNTKKEERSSVIMVIITDGQENASRTFSSRDVKMMVEKAEGKNWAFQFLGANIDAFSVGSAFGFSSYNTMQYNTKNIHSTMATASRRSADMKHSLAAGDSITNSYASTMYTQEEIDKANE